MKNELLHIGSFTIYGYGLMIGLGVLFAYLLGEYRAKKHGLNEEVIFPFLIWVVLIGILGAKLLYVITQFKDIIKNPKDFSDLTDGYVVYGGIIAGFFAAILFCKFRKIDFFKYLDLMIPSVALGQAFGRVGCFLAGCCYGRETDSIIGIAFKDSAFAPNGVKLIPTQLIASGLDLINFAFLLIMSKKKIGDGSLIGIYLMTYSVGRFVLEFFRGDLIRGSVGGISTSQFIAIFTFGLGLGIFLRRFRKTDADTN